jgi:hypothetical protein
MLDLIAQYIGADAISLIAGEYVPEARNFRTTVVNWGQVQEPIPRDFSVAEPAEFQAFCRGFTKFVRRVHCKYIC